MIIIFLIFKLQFILLNILRLSELLEPGWEFESEHDDCDHHLRVRRHVRRRHDRGRDRDQSPSDVLVLQPPPWSQSQAEPRLAPPAVIWPGMGLI